MKRAVRLPAVLLAAFLLPAASVAAAPLTLGELVAAVTRSSPDYMRSQAVLDAAEYDYRASLASFLPSVSASVPASLSDTLHAKQATGLELTGQYGLAAGPSVTVTQLLPTAGTLYATASDQILVNGLEAVAPAAYAGSYPTGARLTNEAAFRAGLSQPLYFGDAYGAARQALDGARQGGRIRGAGGRNAVVVQAVSDFFGLKKTLYSMTLIRARIGSDQTNLERADKELALGRGTQATLLAARTALLKSQTDLLEAELAYDTTLRRFRASYGLPEDATPDPEVPALSVGTVDADAAVARAMASHPDVQAARVLADMKRTEMVAAAKDNAPLFKLEASFTMDNGLEPLRLGLFPGGSGFLDNDAASQSASLSVGLQLKVFDGGAFENAMKRRQAEQAELEAAWRSVSVQAESEVRTLADLLTRLSKLRELYLLQEDAAEGEYQRVLKNRELGNATDADSREALLDLEAVRMTLRQNTIDRNLAWLRLLAAQGMDVAAELAKETGA